MGVDQGLTTDKLYQILGNTTEFLGTYGAPGDAKISLITLNIMYDTIFGRLPDADGASYWLGTGLSNSQVLYYLGTSDPAKSYTAQAINAFELAQIAGNNTPSGISLYNFGGGPPQGATTATSAQNTSTGDSLNAVVATLSAPTSGDGIRLVGVGDTQFNDTGVHVL